MAIELSRVGGFLKFVEPSKSLVKYFNLNEIIVFVRGDAVNFCDGRFYSYLDISSPTFASAEDLADQIGIWKAEAQAGSGASNITVVANYSALPNPTTVSGELYFVEDSQGTKWLPGGLGGTYYNAGIYYSNGITWKYTDTPYNASLTTVNTGVNDEQFLTPFTFTNSDKILNSFQKNVDDSDDIAEGSVNLFVTQAEKDKWDTKENVLVEGANITIDRTTPTAPVISANVSGDLTDHHAGQYLVEPSETLVINLKKEMIVSFLDLEGGLDLQGILTIGL